MLLDFIPESLISRGGYTGEHVGDASPDIHAPGYVPTFLCRLYLCLPMIQSDYSLFQGSHLPSQGCHVTQTQLQCMLCRSQSHTMESLRCNRMHGGSRNYNSTLEGMNCQRGYHKSATKPGFTRGEMLGRRRILRKRPEVWGMIFDIPGHSVDIMDCISLL